MAPCVQMSYGRPPGRSDNLKPALGLISPPGALPNGKETAKSRLVRLTI
jgi:hypothetical protein